MSPLVGKSTSFDSNSNTLPSKMVAALSVIVFAIAIFFRKQSAAANTVSISDLNLTIVPAGEERRHYLHEARGIVMEYISNSGSKITFKVSREDAVSQAGKLSDGRILEEYAKILCVRSRAIEAARAVSTQLDLAVSTATSDTSALMVSLRLSQILFTQGQFLKMVQLLQDKLDQGSLSWPPFWWGHMQFRLALLWSNLNGTASGLSAESFLQKVCAGLQAQLEFVVQEGSDACVGAANIRNWRAPSLSAINTFTTKGWVFWTTPISADSIKELRRHMLARFYHDTAQASLHDQRQLRHGWHNDPMAAFFQYAFAEILRNALGFDLVPTYVYSVVYTPGGQLFPHRDRPDNEVSLTVSLGSEPPNFVWPLFMDEDAFLLQPGDAILYKGADVTHSRKPLEKGYMALQVIFAFRRQCDECCHLV